MNKSTHFTGQPIIKQLMTLLDSSIVNRTARTYQSDRYYKRFKTCDRLVPMLFDTLIGVSSLREQSSVMLACEGKNNHLNMKHFPRRITISDANAKVSSDVFGAIYHPLLKRYRGFFFGQQPLPSGGKRFKDYRFHNH